MSDVCLPRSRANLLAAVAEEHVETTPDLQPGYGGVGWTHCNLFVERVLKRLGVPFPPGLLANQQFTWLNSYASRLEGWWECSEQRAAERTVLGLPTVPAWFNPGGHGHIAICVPPIAPAVCLCVAAAGSKNHENIALSGSFGPHAPSFFTHE